MYYFIKSAMERQNLKILNIILLQNYKKNNLDIS